MKKSYLTKEQSTKWQRILNNAIRKQNQPNELNRIEQKALSWYYKYVDLMKEKLSILNID